MGFISNFLAPYKLWLSSGLIILGVAIVGLGVFKYKRAISRADKAEASLAVYKVQEKALTDMRMLENAQNLAAANKKRDAAIKTSDETLAKFNLANIDRNQLAIKVRILNDKINQSAVLNYSTISKMETVANPTRSNINGSLRLSASRDSTAASEKPSITSKLSTADSDAATLRQACRLTTIDLLKAYNIIEADTLACGREK